MVCIYGTRKKKELLVSLQGFLRQKRRDETGNGERRKTRLVRLDIRSEKTHHNNRRNQPSDVRHESSEEIWFGERLGRGERFGWVSTGVEGKVESESERDEDSC